jgi:hypothetical protein
MTVQIIQILTVQIMTVQILTVQIMTGHRLNADPYVAVPLNNASVSEPFSCFLYNSLNVDL